MNLKKAKDKLDSFLNLEDGWHFNSGKKITKEAVEASKTLMESSSFEMDVFPSEDGGVGVSFFSPTGKENVLEFQIYPSGTLFNSWREDADSFFDEEDCISLERALKNIEMFEEEHVSECLDEEERSRYRKNERY